MRTTPRRLAAELAKRLSIPADHVKPLEWTAAGAIVIALAAP